MNYDFQNKKYTEDEIRHIIKNNSLTNMDWNCISVYQDLSEDFIREFRDKLYWRHMSYYQKLSEDFIWEMIDKININYLSIENLSLFEIEEFRFFYNHIRDNAPFEEDEIIPYINILQKRKSLLRIVVNKNLLPEHIEEYLLI